MRLKHLMVSLVALSAALTLLAGCGIASNEPIMTNNVAGFGALSTQGLTQGFQAIHDALFAKIDVNHDGYIDENEAGPYFNLQTEFPEAAHGQDRISKADFIAYATAGGFLRPQDTPAAFVQRMRNFLAQVFQRLDKPAPNSGFFAHGDGYLEPAELSNQAVAQLGLGFAYPRLHFQVAITSFDPTDIKAADVLGLGKLTQSEFEDLYMRAIVRAINPNYQPDPAPSTSPASNDAPASANSLIDWWDN